MTAAVTPDLDRLAIDTIRTLSIDAVQQANSGHPGAPMGAAPMAYTLWTRFLRHAPTHPDWPDRDRFVLSAGHASMLLYSLLHLTGYELSLDDIKAFRQWGSRTPGHPESGLTPGVEATTGPLGQGLANAVGMAIAERRLAAEFNRDDHDIVDHWTYVIASDGDLQEGIASEASSLAGHLRLGKLIVLYDDNHVQLDGPTSMAWSEDVPKRFDAYGWHTQRVKDGNDIAAIESAIDAARADDRPSLIAVRTHIGFGSPNKQDTAKAHGEPLGTEEIKLTKRNLGWPTEESFFVPAEALAHWRKARDRGAALHEGWRRQLIAYSKAHPELAKEFGRRIQGDLPAGWESAIPTFTKENGNVASRAASGIVLGALVEKVPELVGGSADLTPSNNTQPKSFKEFSAHDRASRYVHYGIREHGMAGIMNGLALHGGIIPYGGTFLIFSDYMRPSQRLASIMHQRVIYVFTHDSIGLGEDGPTHQPIEQLTALRAIPGFTMIRPADATETAEAWRFALKHKTGPVALALTRQKLGFIDREKHGAAAGLAKGAYVLADAPNGAPDVVLISSGSEVALILEAYTKLTDQGVRARAVSMPSHELFAAQPAEYRDSVLPPGTKRVAIEAAHPMSWYRWVGSDGVVLGIDRFGASAPYADIYKGLGLTVDKLVETATRLAQGR
jgi:transketolase